MKSRSCKRLCVTAVALGWLSLTAAGFGALAFHESKPGRVNPAPAEWPQDCRLPLSTTGKTLVLFLHPECPCSRATLNELQELLGGVASPPRVLAVLEGSRGVLGDRAAALGAVCSIDADGSLARKFGAATSGHLFVFNPAGGRLFSGGITLGRGHQGPNPGAVAVEQLLKGQPAAATTVPVFGCALNDD